MNEVFILANPSSGMNKAEEAANYIKELYTDWQKKRVTSYLTHLL